MCVQQIWQTFPDTNECSGLADGSFQVSCTTVDAWPQPAAKSQRDLDGMRAQLVALAVGCPHTRSNPSSCPLHELRQQDPSAIIDWLDTLQDDERDYLIRYHHCCLATWKNKSVVGRRNGPTPLRAKVPRRTNRVPVTAGLTSTR